MSSVSLRLAAILAPLSLVGAVCAHAAPAHIYEIPAQPLDQALLQLGVVSGRQIVFAPDAVRGRSSRPLRGELDVMAALQQMLPPGLEAQSRGALVIVRSVEIKTPSPPPPEPSAEGRQMAAPESWAPVETLVVTALKYETLLQRTPISISVASGVGDRGETSLDDFYYRIPGLHVTTNGTSQQRLAIRGVRSVGEATTGLYYDETPVTGPAGSAADAGSTQPDLSLFDVERIEVLRGPQGTLYGAGSMGGTVRVIFNKPDLTQAGGRVELRGGLTENGAPTTSVRAVGNLPIFEQKLGVRLALYGEDLGGFVDNVRFNRRDVNGERSNGARGSVAFHPTPTISITGMATYHEQDVGDAIHFWSRTLGRYNSDAPVVAQYRGSLGLANITAQWDTPFANFVATSSRYHWKTLNVTDYTATLTRSAADPVACTRFFSLTDACDSGQATIFAAYAAERLPGAWHQHSILRSEIEEVRVSSPGSGWLGWTIGVFREERRDDFASTVYRADADTGEVLTREEPTGYRTVETRVRQTAGFGEISLRPVQRFNLTAGARRFNYYKTVGGEVFIPNRITGSDLTPFREVSAQHDGWVSKLSASVEPTPHSLFYATRSEGFRPGGANNVPGAGAEVPESYAPDHLQSYELGSKIELRGGKVTLNSAVYLIDWRDMQVSAGSPNGAWRFNTNAGRAQIIGGEVEAIAVPRSGLWLMVNAAYTEAQIVEDQRNDFGVATGQAGDRVPFIPRWTAAASLLKRGMINAYRTAARLDYSYTGSSGSQFQTSAASYTIQPAYGLVDLQFAAEKDGIELSARLTNLFNVAAPQIVQANLPVGSGQTYGVRPRTLTLILRRSF